MTSLQKAWSFIRAEEGGFQNDPADHGNWTGGKVNVGELKGTKYGISAASYPMLDIAGLSEDDAFRIFERDYWNECKCGQLPSPLALVVADCAFNQGKWAAANLLQEAVGTRQDGIIGPITLNAARTKPLKQTLPKLIAARCDRYAKSKNFDRFGKGWFRRVAACLMTALEPL